MIKVFSKNNCPQCKMLKKQLDAKGVDYQEINLDDHPEKIDYVKSLGYSSAPVVEFEDFTFSGFNPGKLRELITLVGK